LGDGIFPSSNFLGVLVDWLIDTTATDGGSAQALALLEEHLQRHAVDPGSVTQALAALPDDLTRAAQTAAGRPLHLQLDWTTQRPVLDVAVLEQADDDVPTGQPVPAKHRARVRSWPRHHVARAEITLARRSQATFAAGPPPLVEDVLDPEAHGPATVALALVTALEAHPTASPPQAAAIAGSLIATAGTGADEVTDAQGAAEAFVRLHNALGSEAYVVETDEDRVELAVTKCPFGAVDGPASSLCHVSSGLAGQLAAKVRGTATVVLDEAIVAGDPECHLQVLLREPEEGDEGQGYFWPPRAAPNVDTVPHLDLSVALPRESVSVPVVRRLAAQALRAFGVLDEDVDDVQLAITEACANVIDHAGATDTYDVKIELSADRCAITVVDQGGGFDVDQVPARPDDDAEMGRGVALMRALVDNVAFRNEPQAGAVVHMVKTLRYVEDHPLRRG
jgi:serine/threonine-protein kinase RsbW